MINNINNLPTVVLDQIYQYIPHVITAQMNRKSYQENRYSVRKAIPVLNYENYIRQMIRRDYNFVFICLLNENYLRWINISNYKYSNMIFDNYIQYLIHISIEYNATRCREMINDTIKSQKSGKRHKRIRTKNRKWTN